jgi:RNA polymerase sigma-70 factor (ECF subfamily)
MQQRELVARARRGDGAAFAALVAPHLPRMLELARIVSGTSSEAEDIVQESLTRVLRSLGRFDADRPFAPWFAAIVANQARNWRRSAGRQRRVVSRVAGLAAVGGDDVEEQAIAHGEGSALLAIIRELDINDREVLAMRYLLGMSEAEAAVGLGCTIGTVKSRTSRALARLRAQLTKDVTHAR